MNDARRKAIQAVKDALESAKIDLETIAGEERDYYDNMPESFQQGEKGTKADEDATTLEDAVSELETIIANLDNID